MLVSSRKTARKPWCSTDLEFGLRNLRMFVCHIIGQKYVLKISVAKGSSKLGAPLVGREVIPLSHTNMQDVMRVHMSKEFSAHRSMPRNIKPEGARHMPGHLIKEEVVVCIWDCHNPSPPLHSEKIPLKGTVRDFMARAQH
jgi:hypothetical protein